MQEESVEIEANMNVKVLGIEYVFTFKQVTPVVYHDSSGDPMSRNYPNTFGGGREMAVKW